MKNNKITDAYERVKLNETERQLIWEKVTAKRQQKSRVIPAFAATAAVFAVIFLVYFSIPAQASNSFTAVAYVPGHRSDGTPERIELDSHAVQQINGDEEWLEASLQANLFVQKQGYSDDDGYVYFTIAFDITGDNIEHVELSLEWSFFAKQRIDNNDVLLSTIVDSGSIVDLVFGTDFEMLGDRISLDDMKSEDYLFAIAVPMIPLSPYSDYLILYTKWVYIDVYFENGEKQSQSMLFHIRDNIGGTLLHRDYGTLGASRLTDVDLGDATLIPESVQVLSQYDDTTGRWGEKMYIWKRERGDIFTSRLAFSNPYLLSGFGPIDEQRYEPYLTNDKVIIPIIRLEENGDLVAMEYMLTDAAGKYFLHFWR